MPDVGLEELRYMMVLLLHMSEGAVGTVSLQDVTSFLSLVHSWTAQVGSSVHVCFNYP